MKRILAVGALAVLPAAGLALGLRAHGRASEAAVTQGWLRTLEASVHNVQRRIDVWRTNHARETALAAALAAGESPSPPRLEGARGLLGAYGLRVVDGAGVALGRAELRRDARGNVATVSAARVGSTGRVLVRTGPLDPVLRRILPFAYREFPSSRAVTVFRSGSEVIAVRALQVAPGGPDTVRVEAVPYARAPALWRAALAGRDTSGTWLAPGAPPQLAAVAAAPDGSFGVVSSLDRDAALAEIRRRVRHVHAAAWVLFAALAATAALLVLAARTARRRRAAEAESRALEARLARAELEALRVQLQPHFLFNTLNTVVGLVDTEPAEARAVVERLSALLRVALRATADAEVALADELAVLDHYLAIQQTRFRGRLSVAVSAQPGSERALVPSLILQPLVENAIRHGTAPRAAPGRVEITARGSGGRLTVEVTDDGVGIPPGHREGIGLANTRARLESLFGDGHHFTVRPRPGGGTVARLEIPFREAAA